MLLYFILIVGFAAIFRVINGNLIEFKGDEAINLFLASRPLFGHPFPPGGTISSFGILNPPLLTYALFPLTFLSTDPKIVSLSIGFINALSIGFLFLLIHKYYGKSIALISTTLLAFSPWSILYSRKIWAQDLMLPFLIPWFFSIHQIVITKKLFYWTIYSIFSLLLIQLYLPNIFFVAITTIFLLTQKGIQPNVRYTLPGIIVGLLPLIPFIAYQVVNNCPDCTVLTNASQKLSTTYDLLLFIRPLQIMSQGNFQFILGEDMITFAKNYPFVYELRKIFYIEYLLLPISMVLFWIQFPKLRFFVYASASLPLLYFMLRIVPHMHYFITLTPFLFLFLAYAISKAIHSKKALIKLTSLLILVLLVVTSVSFNSVFFDLLQKQKSLKGDYGSAFVLTQEAKKRPLEKYKNTKEYQEMLITSYIPRSFIYGNLPGGKMLYDFQLTEKRLPLLEQRLIEVPEDVRVQNELIAYFTRPPITQVTLLYIKEKSSEIPGYLIIFEEVSKRFEEQKVSLL